MKSPIPARLVPPGPGLAVAARRRAPFWGGFRWRTDYTDLGDDHRSLLGHHERTAWGLVLTLLALYAILDVGSELLVGEPAAQAVWRLGLLAALGIGAVALGCRRLFDQAADQFRLEEAAQAAEEEAARLQGALLAVNTMQHHLSNQLALTRGYTELLAESPGLATDARESACEALRGVVGAINVIDELRTITCLETDRHLTGPAVLDLARSRGAARG